MLILTSVCNKGKNILLLILLLQVEILISQAFLKRGETILLKADNRLLCYCIRLTFPSHDLPTALVVMVVVVAIKVI